MRTKSLRMRTKSLRMRTKSLRMRTKSLRMRTKSLRVRTKSLRVRTKSLRMRTFARDLYQTSGHMTDRRYVLDALVSLAMYRSGRISASSFSLGSVWYAQYAWWYFSLYVCDFIHICVQSFTVGM
jgi:hypothetical protein